MKDSESSECIEKLIVRVPTKKNTLRKKVEVGVLKEISTEFLIYSEI